MAEGHEAQSAGPKATSHVDNLQVVGVVGGGAKRLEAGLSGMEVLNGVGQ